MAGNREHVPSFVRANKTQNVIVLPGGVQEEYRVHTRMITRYSGVQQGEGPALLYGARHSYYGDRNSYPRMI